MTLVERLVALRRRALGYRYDYDSAVQGEIIARVQAKFGAVLDDPDGGRRRPARAAAHYCAQLSLRPAWSAWAIEAAALPALPLFLMWAWLRSVFIPRRTTTACEGARLVFAGRYRVNPEIFLVPDELRVPSLVTRELVGSHLDPKDVAFILRVFIHAIRLRTPFPLQFALKCAVDLAATRAALQGLRPAWVIVYWEFNCAATAVGDALSRDGIALYNVMHGDKILFAKDAFFEAARFYCWNASYVDLFRREKMRADFRLFENPGFRLSAGEAAWVAVNRPRGIGLVAPLAAALDADARAAGEAARTLAAACNALAARHPVTVRPHPFYPEDFAPLSTALSEQVHVTTPREESPRAFVLRHAVLVGALSTVLLEAAHIGRAVILLRTAATVAFEREHHLYRLPNVRACTIADLESTVEAVLSHL